MRLRIAAFSLLVPLSVAAAGMSPASAAIDPGYPAFSENTFSRNGWVAERIAVTQGARLSIEAITKLKDSRRSAVGFWILRDDRSLSGGMQFFGPSAAAIERHVEVGPGDIVMDEHYGGSFGNGGMTANLQFTRPGEYFVVVVASSDGAIGAELNLYGDAGLTSVSKTTGTGTFVYGDTDFRGTANVVWSEGCLPPYPYWLACPGAAAQADVEAQVTIAHSLFGVFGSTSPASVSSWSGPQGASTTRVGGSFGWFGSAPGGYTFRIDANAGTAYFNGVTAWGADVHLP